MSDEGQGSPREYAARVTIRDKHDARFLSYGATRFLKKLEGSEKHSPKQSGEGREIGEIRCHSERGWRVICPFTEAQLQIRGHDLDANSRKPFVVFEKCGSECGTVQ